MVKEISELEKWISGMMIFRLNKRGVVARHRSHVHHD